MEYNHQLILCIVDEGFSESVMNAAKQCGATGGTVIMAKGTANKESERYFNITIQPNKEIVMILVPTDLRDVILHALYTQVGLNTMGHGIAFALPVDNVVGLSKKMPPLPKQELAEAAADTTENSVAQAEVNTTDNTTLAATEPNIDSNKPVKEEDKPA